VARRQRLPIPGDWTVRVTARTSDVDEFTGISTTSVR
jgi:hypothetical protein